jgi:hypothetical protein
MQSRGSVISLTGSVRPMNPIYHKADLPTGSSTSHFSVSEQVRSAIALLRDAILPDGIDGAGI